MRLLGEMSCASILLSASLKYEGSVILQIHGDGPVRLAVAECNAKLGFRSTIKMSETLEPAPGADWKALVNQNNLGRFSVVLDPKIDNQHPYQGIVPLHEAGVAQALESYMQRSEQLPTRLWLACNGERAAGLLLQKMPHQGGTNKKSDAQSEAATEASDDDWERLITLAQTVTAEELLNVEAETLLHRLFWQEAPKLLEDKPVQFSCSCSRARVGRMLKTLGAEEVESILAEQGQVDVHWPTTSMQSTALRSLRASIHLLRRILQRSTSRCNGLGPLNEALTRLNETKLITGPLLCCAGATLKIPDLGL
jgi:molecular chaperone Hsp33